MLNSSEKVKVAKIISEEIWNSTQNTIEIDKHCETKLRNTYPNLSELEITDILDEIEKRVISYIKKKIKHCEEQSIAPPYEFDDYPPNMLLRYSLKHQEEPQISFLRKHQGEILKAIKKMPWKGFENLCKHILEINGIIKSFLTPPCQEGIDFYGLIDMDKYFPGVLLRGCKLRVIGQVKRVSIKIHQSWIRTFKTYCDDVKNKNGRVLRKFPKWFKEIETPILGIFITTSSFEKGAIRYARKEGITIKTGEQVVEDLIKSPRRDEWFSKNKNGRLKFDEALFIKSFGEN